MSKINIFILFTFLLSSCSSMDDASKVLRNEKIKTTDEFLVKKREPLLLPPDYKTIPKPGSIKKTQINEKDRVKKLISPSNVDGLKNKSPTSTETSILNKIRK
ncbi:DUF3035 domain-containing protein [Pelagibacteraceae bacterium]|jgi:hypothetical protein|nr:DUF3035 domain-containing protein [Pelagibacteraceae bacterium]